ncbi:MAG: ribonuclease Z [Desulfatirhabdiaceae bacterium]
MRPALHPRLVNPPEADPAVYIPFNFQNRSMLFDLGNLEALSSREILKISHIFVSHMHMDHFYGFDRVLRLCLGRNKRIHLFGPEKFLSCIEGKLSGYSWDLVGHYSHPFTIVATEIQKDCQVYQEYPCSTGFQPVGAPRIKPVEPILLAEPSMEVIYTCLDHSNVCLAYALAERFHINIIRDELVALGLSTGPWLMEFKNALYRQADPEQEFEIAIPALNGQKISLGALADRIARITSGQKIVYITDAVYSESNIKKMVKLAESADHLFIEAAFSEAERSLADGKKHLTAWQAGTIAGMARVRNFTLFHFSPRYGGNTRFLESEAQSAYENKMRMDMNRLTLYPDYKRRNV